MNSREKNARIVWRMKSVEVTRVMPSRWATSAATVDLPVPVEPPTKSTIGTSSDCSVGVAAQPARRRPRPPRRRAPRRASSSSRSTSIERAPRSARSSSIRRRELVRAVGRHAGRDQRARHQPLRVRQPARSPSGSGSPCRRCAHARAPSRAAARAAPRRARRRRRSFAASTTRLPRASACSATTSIAAAFTSTRYVSASTARARRAARRGRRGCAETCTTSASRCETSARPGGEDRDAPLERLQRAQAQRRATRAGSAQSTATTRSEIRRR